MPLYASAFFLPTSPSIPFLLEDIYLRGGYRTVATIDDRNAIRPAARKRGMVVFVQEDSTMYWIPGSTAGIAAWKELDVTQYVKFAFKEPLKLDIDEETGERTISIMEDRLLPAEEGEAGYVLVSTEDGPAWVELDALPTIGEEDAGKALILDYERKPFWGKIEALPPSDAADKGKALVLDEEGTPYWGIALPETDDVEEGSSLSIDENRLPFWKPPTVKPGRVEGVFDLGSLSPEGDRTQSFDIQASTVMILQFTVSAPEIQVELHSTDEFTDDNPFVFVSSLAKLSDDGISYDDEGTRTVFRRYAFYSDAQNQSKLHVKVTNVGDTMRNINIGMVYLNLE